ncbi:hypothetical protein AAHE18_11G031200 [Arachis hypogaea]
MAAASLLNPCSSLASTAATSTTTTSISKPSSFPLFHNQTLPKPTATTTTCAASSHNHNSPIPKPQQHQHSSLFSFSDDDEKPREECGVVGIYDDPEASRLCYLAPHALQHRGQEGAGSTSSPASRHRPCPLLHWRWDTLQKPVSSSSRG